MCIHLVRCSANVHEIRSIFIHTELGEDVSSQVVRSSVTSRAADKWRQTWGRVSVPALDDGLFHTRGLLWGRRTRWFLAHHWQELQQQFGALGLPCTWFTAAVHTQHDDTHNQHLINKKTPENSLTFSDISLSHSASSVSLTLRFVLSSQSYVISLWTPPEETTV